MIRAVMVEGSVPGSPCGIRDYAHLLSEAMGPDSAGVRHIDVVSDLRRHRLLAMRHARRAVARSAGCLPNCDVIHAHYSDFSWNGVRAYEDGYELFTREVVRTSAGRRSAVAAPAVPRLFVTLHEHPWFRDGHAWDRPATLADKLFARLAGYRPIPAVLPLEVLMRHRGIHVHHAWQRDVLLANGVPGDRIRIIPHPVPVCRATPEATERFKARFGLSGKRVLAMTGFVLERKRHDRVLDVLGALPGNVVLCVLGGTNGVAAERHLAWLKQRASELGVSNRFLVTGYLPEDEMNAGLLAAEVFVAPYGEVSSSGSVARCVAAGAPIVAGACPTFSDLASGGAGIILVDPGNKQALTQALTGALGGATGDLRASNAAYAARWSFGTVAATLQEWYGDTDEVRREA